MAQALSVLAVNVNGLSASRKRRAFILQLLQGHWDVIVLTETHCPSSDTAEQWPVDRSLLPPLERATARAAAHSMSSYTSTCSTW
jgi:hypothetical protein